MDFNVEFHKFADATGIFFIDEDATEVTTEEFESELKSGYQAGIVLLPIQGQLQFQVAVLTPYHKDKFKLDPEFLITKFKEFFKQKSTYDIDQFGKENYLLGEIIYE